MPEIPPPLCTLWVGPSLGAVERACLRSALAQGHAVALYCYDVPSGVPAGIDIRDAATIMPADRIIHYRNGSVSLFSNMFRYALLKQGKGVWIDADIYLLRPIPDDDYVIGWQCNSWLNGAVLRIPDSAPLVDELEAMFDERLIPPWLPPLSMIAAWYRRLTTGRSDIASMPWGSFGPAALTALCRKLNLLGLASPPHIFYPVPYQQADWIFEPREMEPAFIRPDTVAIHLWNEMIKHRKTETGLPGSFFARLQEEGA